MYTRIFIFSLFTSLGIALPVFPTARPYIPSGLGPLPSITTNACIVPRGLANTEGEIITGPIPDKWKHTHGVLSPDIKAEERSMNGDCEESVACANLWDDLKEVKDRLKDEIEHQIQEELDDRDLGDCKPWMWGC